jgi:hypothetical protein
LREEDEALLGEVSGWTGRVPDATIETTNDGSDRLQFEHLKRMREY